MATSGGSSGEYEDGVRDIMDELICTICEEDRPLHVLPCQHRFCKICLGEHISATHGSKFDIDCNRLSGNSVTSNLP